MSKRYIKNIYCLPTLSNMLYSKLPLINIAKNNNLFFQHNNKNIDLYANIKTIKFNTINKSNLTHVTNICKLSYVKNEKIFEFDEEYEYYEIPENKNISIKYKITVNKNIGDNSNYNRILMEEINSMSLQIILDKKNNLLSNDFLNIFPNSTQRLLDEIEYIIEKNKNDVKIV
jgi:hypothetical protein